MDFARPAVLVFWAFVQILLFCEFGVRLTEKFYEISNEIFHFDWFILPIDIQRMLPFISYATQKPMIIGGFGNVQCTRDSLKNVRREFERRYFAELRPSEINYR